MGERIAGRDGRPDHVPGSWNRTLFVAGVGLASLATLVLATVSWGGSVQSTLTPTLLGVVGLAAVGDSPSEIEQLTAKIRQFRAGESVEFSTDREDELGDLYEAVDELAETVRERDAAFETSERYRQRVYEVTSASDLSDDEKVDRLLELGCERLDAENGHVVRIDEHEGRHEVERASGSDIVPAGTVTDLSETFCRETIRAEDSLGIAHAPAAGYDDDPAFRTWGIGCYIGAKIVVEDELYGTVCFVNEQPRDSQFSAPEKSFVDLLSQWISHIYERRQRESTHRIRERAIDAAPIGVAIAEARGEDNPLVQVNDAFERMTGYEAEAALGRDCRFLQGEDTDEQSVAELRAAIDAERPVTTELKNYRADGTEFWNRVSIAPVTDGDGEVTHFVGFQEDVTERKEREAELERQASLLDSIFDQIPIHLYVKDEEARMIRASSEFFSEYGERDESDVIGKTDLEFLPEEVAEQTYADDRRVIEEGEPVVGSIEHHTDRWFLTSKVPWHSSTGEIRGLIGVTLDITERKEREQALERTSEMLEQSQQLAQVGAWELDVDDGALTSMTWTDEVYRIHDLPVGTDVSPEDAIEFYHPDDRDDVRAAVERATERGESYDFEARLLTADGETRWVRSIGDPHLTDGEVDRIRGSIQDITDRKVAEQRLREREQRLERYREYTDEILDAMDDVFYVVGPDLSIQRWNESLLAVTGYTDEEIAELHPTELVVDEDEPVIASSIQEVFETGSARSEARVRTKDGEVIPYEFAASALEDPDGNQVLVGLGRDVRERKEREEKLRETRDRLAEHNRTLRRLYEISADRETDFEEKLQRLLDLGRERLDTSGAFISRIEPEADEFEFVHASGTIEAISTGSTAPYSETYCRRVVESDDIVEILDAEAEGWGDDPAWERWGLGTYVAQPLYVGGELEGTLAFVDSEPAERPLTDDERAFVELATQWVSYELERREREQELAEYKEFTDDMLDAIDDLFFVHDTDGNLLRWNESFSEVTGYPDQELATMHGMDFVSEAHKEDSAAAIQSVFETGSGRLEAPLLTADGDTIPYEYAASRVENPDGDLRLVGIGRDITERKERERDLRRATQMLEQAQRIAQVGGWELDLRTDPPEMTWTDELYRLHDIPLDADLDLDGIVERYHPDDRERIGELMDRAITAGESYDMEVRLQTAPDRTRWVRAIGEPVREDGEVVRIQGSIQDITAQKEHEQALRSLNEATRGLLGAETEADVADVVVDAAADVLDTGGVVLYLLDSESNRLEPAAYSDGFTAPSGGAPSVGAGDGDSLLWNCFVTGTPTVFDDTDALAHSKLLGPDVGGGLLFPLGDHGVFVVATTATTVDTGTRQLAETLVATTETGLDRLENEASLRERDAELEARNERLQRQVQITDIIRGIDRSLIQANSREEIEQAVCRQLVEAADVAFAWIGAVDGGGETLVPSAWAGTGDEYLDAVSFETDVEAPEPAAATVTSEQPTIVGNVVDDMKREPWRKRALASDFHSVLSVPLTYEGYFYGVLAVYADEPDVFDDLERTVFAELGTNIANSINAIETRRALHADTLVELSLVVDPADTFHGRIATAADCQIEYEGLVTHTDGESRLFFAATGSDPDSIEAVLDDLVSVQDYRLVDESEERLLFEVTVSGAVLPARLVRHGASPRSIRVTDAGMEVVVDVPTKTDVREFFGMVRDIAPSVELVGKRTVERATQTRQELVSDLFDTLTERQLEVLRTAYLAGFFDWPRTSTGEDVAEMLDVTQPTVNRHLRFAQQRLLEQLLDDSTPTAPAD